MVLNIVKLIVLLKTENNLLKKKKKKKKSACLGFLFCENSFLSKYISRTNTLQINKR